MKGNELCEVFSIKLLKEEDCPFWITPKLKKKKAKLNIYPETGLVRIKERKKKASVLALLFPFRVLFAHV